MGLFTIPDGLFQRAPATMMPNKVENLPSMAMTRTQTLQYPLSTSLQYCGEIQNWAQYPYTAYSLPGNPLLPDSCVCFWSVKSKSSDRMVLLPLDSCSFLHLCYDKKQILKRGNVPAATDKQSSDALNLNFSFLTGTPVYFQISTQNLTSISTASTRTPSPPPETCEYSRDALNDMLSLLGSSWLPLCCCWVPTLGD